MAARLDGLATALSDLADKTTTTDTAGTTAGAPALAPDATDTSLRAHVQAQDMAMGVRLAAAEAGLRETIAALDVGLRAHAQEAAAQTQFAVTSFGEKVHLLEVARGLSTDPPGSLFPGSGGRWGNTERAGVEAHAFRQRLNEPQLRVRAAETEAAEQKSERYTTEHDLCNGLSKLDAQLGNPTKALS